MKDPPRTTNFKHDPFFVFFASKISLFMTIRDYLQENFEHTRKADIKEIEEKIIKMKEKLNLMKKEGKKLNSEKSLSREFPNPTKTFVLGLSPQQRDEKVKEIAIKIQNHLKHLPRSQTRFRNIFKQYYLALLQKIKEYKDNSNAPFPLIEKKYVPIKYRAINRDVGKNELEIEFQKMRIPNKYRHFYIDY